MKKQKQHTPRWLPVVLGVSLGVSLAGCGLVPEPLSREERSQAIAEDKVVLFDKQEPLSGPLTLYQAQARALRYNLDHRVKMMERAMSEGQSTIARFDLLPEVMASAGYRNRDNFNASSSRSMRTGRQSLETSTSQDRSRYLGDLVFRWNILDFGVGYFRAQQEGNKALIAEENRRKVSHNLMQDVRAAYWRAVGAQQMESVLQPVLDEARSALENARAAQKEGLQAPLESLRYQKSLVEIVRKLEGIQEQLKLARSELMRLVNLPPNQAFTLAAPAGEQAFAVPKLALPMEQMESLALQMRPELREEMYQTRIGVAEIRKAMLRLLPGVEVNIGGHYDSNSYLLNQHFADWGTQIAKNVFEILSAPQAIGNAETQKALADSRRMAAHMAILTQVHLAQEQFDMASKQYGRAVELDDLNQQINRHIANSAANEASSPMERIRASVDAVLTLVQRYQAYSDVQAALGKMYVSLGFDPLPETVQSHDINALAQALAEVDQDWAQGQFPQPTDTANPAEMPDTPETVGKAEGQGSWLSSLWR